MLQIIENKALQKCCGIMRYFHDQSVRQIPLCDIRNCVDIRCRKLRDLHTDLCISVQRVNHSHMKPGISKRGFVQIKLFLTEIYKVAILLIKLLATSAPSLKNANVIYT